GSGDRGHPALYIGHTSMRSLGPGSLTRREISRMSAWLAPIARPKRALTPVFAGWTRVNALIRAPMAHAGYESAYRGRADPPAGMLLTQHLSGGGSCTCRLEQAEAGRP